MPSSIVLGSADVSSIVSKEHLQTCDLNEIQERLRSKIRKDDDPENQLVNRKSGLNLAVKLESGEEKRCICNGTFSQTVTVTRSWPPAETSARPSTRDTEVKRGLLPAR